MLHYNDPYIKAAKRILAALSWERAVWENPNTALGFHYKFHPEKIDNHIENINRRMPKAYLLYGLIYQMVRKNALYLSVDEATPVETASGTINLLVSQFGPDDYTIYVLHETNQLFRLRTNTLGSYEVKKKIAHASCRKLTRLTRPYWIGEARRTIAD